MYYPVGWPKKLNFRFHHNRRRGRLPNGHGQVVGDNGPAPGPNGDSGEEEVSDDDLVQIVANTDRTLFAILTRTSVHIWFCKPSVEIVSHYRDAKSLMVLGHNRAISWKPDSTMIVITTTEDNLLFYKVAVRDSLEFSYEQNVSAAGMKRDSTSELLFTDKIPSLYLLLSFSTKINYGVTSFLAAEEEVVVCTRSGQIVGVNWDGTFDPGFQWRLSDSTELNVVDIKYSSMIGGFSLVFVNGRMGFVPIHSNQAGAEEAAASDPSTTKYGSCKVQYVADLDNGSTSAINHKYQLIAFGLKNAEGVLCCIDEENMAVNVTHRITLPSNTYPDVAASIGAVTCLQWSPDSTVLACSWERGGVALWSVFGALLMCSLGWDYGLTDAVIRNHRFVMSSLAWAKEGFQLWTLARERETTDQGDKWSTGLMQMSMAKSILASNPSSVSCCCETLILVAEDRLYLGVGASSTSDASNNVASSSKASDEDDMPSTNAQASRMHWKQQPVEVGNHQWIVIQIPNQYLTSNWPIRLAAIDANGQHLAVAGRTGMAHYSMLNRRWKLFGNETQERDFEVCGGMLWYEGYIVCSCYNIVESRFEIRAYPHNTRLDNQFMRLVRVPAEVLVMSMYKNRLLVLLLDGSMHLFGLFERQQHGSIGSGAGGSGGLSTYPATLHLVQLNQIIVSNVAVPPECVASLLLTSLHYETKSSAERAESIIMNVCGRLFFLEKEEKGSTASMAATMDSGSAASVTSETETNSNTGNLTLIYKAVSILASGVENVWVSSSASSTGSGSAAAAPPDRPHLTDALWLSRGCYGMNVWLPLLPSETEKSFPLSSAHNFMSKRIMLPINTHIYPLAVLFRDAVVIGAENETLFWGNSCPVKLPYSVITRTSQVYLHHILRELLKKNLGIHAWAIANSCSSLPYFPHSLELLLHETLEEEATSSQPIPDALLPRVIDFIREFPVFLETIVHCARKTELALWPHLFAVVGNPNELFQRCLDNEQLETAASYLLVLQNLERTSVSRKYATLLMDAANKTSNKQLATDLTRFLAAIDPHDFESPPSKGTIAPSAASHPHSTKCVVSPAAVVTELDTHAQQVISVGRKRTVSSSNSLMLHTAAVASATANGSVPNSPDAVTTSQTRSHSLAGPPAPSNKTNAVDNKARESAAPLIRQNSHPPAIANGHISGKQLIRSPSVQITTHKCTNGNSFQHKYEKKPMMANGLVHQQSSSYVKAPQSSASRQNASSSSSSAQPVHNNHHHPLNEHNSSSIAVSSSKPISNGAIIPANHISDMTTDDTPSASSQQCTIS